MHGFGRLGELALDAHDEVEQGHAVAADIADKLMVRATVVQHLDHQGQAAHREIILKGHVLGGDTRLLDVEDALAGVLAVVQRHDAILAHDLELVTVGRVLERRAVEKHQRIRAEVADSRFQDELDAAKKAFLGLAGEADDDLAFSRALALDERLIHRDEMLELDVRALDVLEDHGVHRLHRHVDRESVPEQLGDLDDPFLIVLPRRRHDLQRPAELLLRLEQDLADLLVTREHREIRVGDVQVTDAVRRDLGGDVLDLLGDPLDGEHVDLVEVLVSRVAEGAEERAAAIGLEKRGQATVEEMVQHPVEIRRRDIVELADAVGLEAGHEAGLGRAPGRRRHVGAAEDRGRVVHSRPSVTGGQHPADQARKRNLSLELDVNIRMRPGKQKIKLQRGFMREIRASLDGDDVGIALLGEAGDPLGEVAIPRIITESQYVRRSGLDRLDRRQRVLEKLDVDRLPVDFLGVGGNEADIDGDRVRDQNDRVVRQVAHVDAQRPLPNVH